MPVRRILALLLVASLESAQDGGAMAQTPPSASDAALYTGLFAAAYEGDADEAHRLIAAGSDLEITDGWGRTPLHVAAFRSSDEIVSVLAESGYWSWLPSPSIDFGYQSDRVIAMSS